MAQSNCLDQVKIQIQRAADGACDSGNQLHMETAAGDVIVFDQGKNLRLITVTVIIGAVNDPVDIVGKIGPPDGDAVIMLHISAQGVAVVETGFDKGSAFPFMCHAVCKFVR